MRWGTILLLMCWGCGDDSSADPDVGPDAGLDAVVVDTGTDTEVPDVGAVDAPVVDVPVDSPMDVPVDTPPSLGTCGWSATDMELRCGAGDTPPPDGSVTCTAGVCCTGVCDPDGDGEVCCELATGILTTTFYSAGTCETMVDECTDPP